MKGMAMLQKVTTPENVANLQIMTAKEAAIYLRLSSASMARYRAIGGGPAYVRQSSRKTLYRRSDLDAWLALRVFDSTSAEAAAGFQS